MQSSQELRRGLRFRWRALFAVVIGGFVSGLLGMFYAQRQPYTFWVEANLHVIVGREAGKMDPELLAVNRYRGGPGTPGSSFINGVVALLKSPSVMRATVTSLEEDIPGFHQATLRESHGGIVTRAMSAADAVFRLLDLSMRESLLDRSIQEWTERLTVNVTMRTNVITIECAANDAALGVAFVDRLIEKYMDAHLLAFSHVGAGVMVARELEDLRDRERRVLREARAWRLRTGVMDLVRTMDYLVAQQLAAEERLREIERERSVSAASLEAVDGLLSDVPEREVSRTVSGTDPIWDYINGQVVGAEMLARNLAIQFPEGSPLLNRTREYGKRLQQLLAERPQLKDEIAVTETLNPLRAGLERQQVNVSLGLRALDAELASARRSRDALNDRLVELEGMRGEAEAFAEQLANVRTEINVLKDADLSARMQAVLDGAGLINVRVMDRPRALAQPRRVFGRDYRVSIIQGWVAFGMFVVFAFIMLRAAIREDYSSYGAAGGDR